MFPNVHKRISARILQNGVATTPLSIAMATPRGVGHGAGVRDY